MPDVNTRVITAHVPLPLAEQVDQLAARLDRSRGWIVRQALAAWIEQEEARNRAEPRKPRRTSGREKR
ncbi:ribbon-helix-helix domain-containing protein [Caballeronia pedi]|uniref:ribbon-helix-helix domain-containing protein n=1 Tax=Caballeronia pedi TaxID=1777141 RepID=UPI001ABEF18A|nr:ribbon-helix-helix domain-containing protein [Caballeronia pedi]